MAADTLDSFNLSRRWEQYAVKATFDEAQARVAGQRWPQLSSAQIAEYENRRRNDFECQIFVLPQPIVLAVDVTQVCAIEFGGRDLRFYPPFQLNEQKETSGAFEDAQIPGGEEFVSSRDPLPSESVGGVRMTHGTMNGASWCRGLRVDVQHDADVMKAIPLLLDQICQYTHQWWLRATHNPFLGPKRFGASVDTNFRPMNALRAHGRKEVESAWYGAVQFQPNLGIGGPLTKDLWLLSCHHVANGRAADTGILSFHDAFSDYMAGRDDKCVLNLAIAVEILLSKHRQYVLKRTPNETLDKMIRTSNLVPASVRETLLKLAIDRGHVAHGKPPYIVGKHKEFSLERYLQATRELLDAYLHSIEPGTWPTVMSKPPVRSR
jgi:hypothetical protein